MKNDLTGAKGASLRGSHQLMNILVGQICEQRNLFQVGSVFLCFHEYFPLSVFLLNLFGFERYTFLAGSGRSSFSFSTRSRVLQFTKYRRSTRFWFSILLHFELSCKSYGNCSH